MPGPANFLRNQERNTFVHANADVLNIKFLLLSMHATTDISPETSGLRAETPVPRVTSKALHSPKGTAHRMFILVVCSFFCLL